MARLNYANLSHSGEHIFRDFIGKVSPVEQRVDFIQRKHLYDAIHARESQRDVVSASK